MSASLRKRLLDELNEERSVALDDVRDALRAAVWREAMALHRSLHAELFPDGPAIVVSDTAYAFEGLPS